ncbi:fibronectin type III domain-containing protein [Paenibacillus andongensis]|uniref:golvesin C-terminal-like domain-containing protein n=1 Tax=Paenibacillus andongensis TaxID=2975482 RepID=UPI0021BA8705|nr:right-handed parallel beta-helix repeat-containing protein [Paenibacillus andongensis]
MSRSKLKVLSWLMILIFASNALLFSGAQPARAEVAPSGIVYYVDATLGNDANDGLRTETPWRTMDRVNSQILSPGDKVLFKRGEIWYGSTLKPASSGTNASHIVFDAYGSTTLPKPKISGATPIAVWIGPDANGEYYSSLPAATASKTILLENGRRLKGKMQDSQLPGPVKGYLANGSWALDLNNNYIYYKPSKGTSSENMTELVTGPTRAFDSNSQSYVEVNNLELTGGMDEVGYIAPGSTNVIVKGNDIHAGDGAGVRVNGSSSITLSYNNVYDINSRGIWIESGSTGSAITYNKVSGIGKLSTDDGELTGIEVGGTNTLSKPSNNIIDYNTVNDIGRDFYKGKSGTNARGSMNSTGVVVNSSNMNIIKYNKISSIWRTGIHLKTEFGDSTANNIYGNLISDTGKMYTLDSGSHGIMLENKNGSIGGSKIYNNTIANSKFTSSMGKEAALGLNVYGAATLDNLQVKNNIIALNSGDYAVAVDLDTGSALTNFASDYNLIYRSSGNAVYWKQNGASQVYDFAHIVGNTAGYYSFDKSQESHSKSNDPQFVSVEKSDFHLLASSPAVNAGGDMGLTKDLDSLPAPNNGGFDMGCYESAWSQIDTTPAIVSGSALDLSGMNGGPAGSKGFVKIDGNGDYYFTNEPNNKIKFYGGNLNGSYGTDPTKAEMVIIADRLAAMGYNVVRFSSIDQAYDWAKGIMVKPTSTTVTLDATKLDNFEYFISLLKARGIYIDVDILAYADFSSVPSLSVYGSFAAKYMATLFPDAKTIWQSFAQQWLTHVNPYTGLALKDDPILMGLSPMNESLLYNANFKNPIVKGWLLADFNTFLAAKGHPAVTTFPDSFWDADPSIRDDLAEYFTQKTFNSYNEMKTYLKNVIGVKAPIGGINYINDSLANYWRTQADIHETHLYNGLVDGRGAAFSFAPGSHPRYSMIFAPESKANYVPQYGSTIFKNYIPGLALGQLYQKPFALTEFNQEFPTKGRDDLGMIVASTGAYNGWDMLNRFNFATNVKEAVQQSPLGGVNSFDSATDTLVTMSEYQSNLIFRKGHITASEPKFVIVRDKTSIKTHAASTENEDSESNRMYIPHLFKIVTVYADKPEEPYAIYKITPELTPEQIASGNIPAQNKISITKSMTLKQVAETFINAIDDVNLKNSMLSNLNQNKLVSDTGELIFDLNLNTYLIHTPYVIGAAGTLNNNLFELGPISIKASVDKGTVSAASLDDQPLDKSGRILAIYTTDVAATAEDTIQDLTDANKRTYVKGTLPTLAKYGTAEFGMTTTLDPTKFKAYKLATNGARLEEMPVQVSGQHISINLDTAKGFAFELVAYPIDLPIVVPPTTPPPVVPPAPVKPATEITIDNGSAEFTGTWSTASTNANKYGADYAIVAGGVAGANKMRWRPTIQASGEYEAYYWLPDGNSSMAKNVAFTVYDGKASKALTVDESKPGGQWVSLGTYTFKRGTTGYVEITDNVTGNIVGDAVKFVMRSIIMDDSDAQGTGKWTSSSFNPNYYSDGYVNATNGAGANKLTWKPYIPVSGNYDVYYWLPDGSSNRANAAPFTINYSGDYQVFYVDQTAPGGKWVLFGSFFFDEGTSGYVELNDNASGYVIGDAIKFALPNSTPPVTPEIPPPTPPVTEPVEIIIDNTSATATGTWNLGTSKPNKYGANYSTISADGTGTHKVKWTPTISTEGDYEVYYWLPDGSSDRPSAAQFTVYYSGGSKLYTVDERVVPGGKWVLLGKHHLVPGTSGYVELTDKSSYGNIIADAIRFYLPATPQDLQLPSWNGGGSLTVSNATYNGVTLNWTPATDNVGVTNYKIYQNGALIQTVQGSVYSYDVTGLSPSTSYSYKVTAGDAAGNSSTDSLTNTMKLNVIVTNPLYVSFDNKAKIMEAGEETTVRLMTSTAVWGGNFSVSYDNSLFDVETTDIVLSDQLANLGVTASVYSNVYRADGLLNIKLNLNNQINPQLGSSVELLKIKFKGKQLTGKAIFKVRKESAIAKKDGSFTFAKNDYQDSFILANSNVDGDAIINEQTYVKVLSNIANHLRMTSTDSHFDPRLDMNMDGKIDIVDMVYVYKRLILLRSQR